MEQNVVKTEKIRKAKRQKGIKTRERTTG